MAEIFLHVGPFKTGSTAIQSTLLQNDERLLRDHGILVPRAGRNLRNDAHHNLAWELKDRAQFRPECGGWAEVAEELASVDRAVISSEVLCDCKTLSRAVQNLERLGHVVRVVFVFRHQLSLINSSYTQQVKSFRLNDTFSEFFPGAMSSKRYVYAEYYREVLKAAKTAPLVLDFGRGLLGDFLALLGLTPDDVEPAHGQAALNVSPLAHEIEAIRLSSPIFLNWKVSFFDVLEEAEALRAHYPWDASFFGPTKQQQEDAIAYFAPINRKFFAEFANHQPSEAPEVKPRSLHTDAAGLRPYLVDLLDAVNKRIAEAEAA